MLISISSEDFHFINVKAYRLSRVEESDPIISELAEFVFQLYFQKQSSKTLIQAF